MTGILRLMLYITVLAAGCILLGGGFALIIICFLFCLYTIQIAIQVGQLAWVALGLFVLFMSMTLANLLFRIAATINSARSIEVIDELTGF